MIKVSVMYPNGENRTFDMTYFLSTHMPMVRHKIGPTLKAVAVDEGVSGAEPGSPPKYLAIAHLFFESVDAFTLAFATHGGPIIADIPNYTNSQPMIQVNDVKL